MELPEKDPNEILSATEIAKIAGVARRTVGRWCKSGKLKSTLLGQQYAIVWGDFITFWNQRQSEEE